ncbi:MAG: hypothetical protein ACKPJD_13070 [Planctomycetaceae bacterium]
MNIHDLIERLKEYNDLFGPDCEVRLQTQPHWPFETTIAGVVTAEEVLHNDTCPNLIYILEGTQLGYGSKTAWTLV